MTHPIDKEIIEALKGAKSLLSAFTGPDDAIAVVCLAEIDRLLASFHAELMEGEKTTPGQLVLNWQEEQHEFFKTEITDIVIEYAEWREQQLTTPSPAQARAEAFEDGDLTAEVSNQSACHIVIIKQWDATKKPGSWRTITNLFIPTAEKAESIAAAIRARSAASAPSRVLVTPDRSHIRIDSLDQAMELLAQQQAAIELHLEARASLAARVETLERENAELREQGTDLAKFAEGLWNLLSQLNPHNLPGTLDMMWEAQLHHPRQITLLQFAKEWSEADRDRHAARAAELEGTLTEIVAIPNSEAAQGIMKVIARAALAKKEKK